MRSIIVPPRDYKRLENDGRIVLKGQSIGLYNGDRVRILLQDMCAHEGIAARIAGVTLHTSRGSVTAHHQVERDD